jgi:hypothetical protein
MAIAVSYGEFLIGISLLIGLLSRAASIYGLTPDHRPRREIAEILKIFGDAKDSWRLAFWFAGLNSFLDDERPRDVLATDPERVIAAAKDEVAELQF